MNPLIQLEQHIRTSSRVRRGYRTYQKTPGIDGLTDERLGSYGVYSPSIYPDLASMGPEEYPELFLFFTLGGAKKVICKSMYVGLDLHSYPPRSGNYLAHSLLCPLNEAFNPVELYESYHWKTADEIALEDQNTIPVPELIQLASFRPHPDYFELCWIRKLLLPGPEAPESSVSREYVIRQNMLVIAIDAILNRKKLFIIDHKEYLLSWTMTLLQVFPPEFVFARLNITSFANSNLLLDVCDVLCFEQENQEKARRFAAGAVIVDFQHGAQPTPSVYATVVLESLENEDFARFRKTVFPRIVEAGVFTPKDFDKHALFYNNTDKIAEMPPGDFRLLLSKVSNNQEYVDEIFRKVYSTHRADLCPLIWQQLEINRGLSIQTFRDCTKYRMPPNDDRDWFEFESHVANAVGLSTLQKVKEFFDIAPSSFLERDRLFADTILSIVGTNPDQDTIQEARQLIRESNISLTAEQEEQLHRAEAYHSTVAELKVSEPEAQYLLFHVHSPELTKTQQDELITYLKPLSWKLFFNWYVSAPELLRTLYDISNIRDLLPNRKMAMVLLSADTAHDPAELAKNYQALKPDDKDAFRAAMNNSTRQILLRGLPLEETLALMPRGGADEFLSQRVGQAIKNPQDDQIWELAAFVEKNPQIFASSESTGLSTGLSVLYAALNDPIFNIPIKYESLAAGLQDKGLLSRNVRRDRMEIDLSSLQAIGKLSHLADIKNLLKNDKFDWKSLEAIVKLPWPHYAWEVLFDNLEPVYQLKLPKDLRYLLMLVERSEEGRDPDAFKFRYSYECWRFIFYQYYIFLILRNNKRHYLNLLENTFINWQEYDFILASLRVLLADPESNETYDHFLHPTNGRHTAGILKTHGPSWKPEK